MSSDSLKDDLLADAEIAVRNDVAYRLTDRGVYPEGTWGEHNNKAE